MAKNNDKQDPTPEDDMAAQRLLREADEALRQDKLKALWEEWGSTIIGSVLMIILGTTLGVAWQGWRADRQSDATALIMEADRNPEARAELRGHYQGISALLAAAKAVNDDEANAETLQSLLAEAKESGLPIEWDILAAWGQMRINAEQAETVENKTAIATEMAEAARDNDNPYSALMMMEAGIIHGEAENYEAAISLLQEATLSIDSSNLPTLAGRIQSYLQLYKTESML